jgi:hypothetical protein
MSPTPSASMSIPTTACNLFSATEILVFTWRHSRSRESSSSHCGQAFDLTGEFVINERSRNLRDRILRIERHQESGRIDIHEGVPSMAEVTPRLFRRGRPSKKGLETLAQMGINIVVDGRGQIEIRSRPQTLILVDHSSECGLGSFSASPTNPYSATMPPSVVARGDSPYELRNRTRRCRRSRRRTRYGSMLTKEQVSNHLVDRPVTYLLGEVDVLPLGRFPMQRAPRLPVHSISLTGLASPKT